MAAHPEATFQKSLVRGLRQVVLPGTIVHFSANEVREGGVEGAKKQAINLAMGIHPGFTDLVVLSNGIVLFLEAKSLVGQLRKEQVTFRDEVLAQGHHWALVRTIDDALAAMKTAGIKTRVVSVGAR